MCGIVGVLYSDSTRPANEDRLRRAAALIATRGPDGVGVHAADGVGFAHTRLSLVDLDERSNQPFWDPSGRYCLVYNGELYDFREMRDALKERGVEFRTTSDTEVLLLALIHDGPEATLPRLRGMFAFAFYDTQERTLLLVRDRFGIKPLYLYHDGEKVLFGSAVRAMRPWIDLQPDHTQILRYLMTAAAPVRHTGYFADITIVPPGSAITVRPGAEPVMETFIDLPGMIDRDLNAELEGLSAEQMIDRVDQQMQQSVERMLFADAPVGALCSGGVDSSLLMAIAKKFHTNLAIFHADVVGPHSEYDAAKELADHLKLDLLTVETRDHDFTDLIPEVIWHYEFPFSGHPHSVPFHMVAHLVRRNNVKAVLTGEGSDECFLGYNHIAMEPFWRSYHKAVDRVDSLIGRIPGYGPNLSRGGGRTPQLVVDLMARFQYTLQQNHARSTYEQRMGRKPDRGIRTLDLLANHLITLLHRNDAMGMSASVEARFPFLDEDLVATAINMPVRHKLKFSPGVWEKEHPLVRDKWIIRKVADRYVPKVLSQRKKRGFDVSALRRMAVAKGFFDRGFIKSCLRLTRPGMDLLFESADQGVRMKLMMLEAWGRMFFRDEQPDTVRDHLKEQASFPS